MKRVVALAWAVSALANLLMASQAVAADLSLRMNRTMRVAPASNTGGYSSTCSGCIQACRRNSGPIEKICESLCLETCGNR
jgi:hypothetical protein